MAVFKDQPAKLIERLTTEGERTRSFFSSVPEESWLEKIYSDGDEWTIQEILTHIVQAEDAIQRLILGILAGGEGTPNRFDLDAYNQRKVTESHGRSTSDLIDLFTERRGKTIKLVAGMSGSDLTRIGRHPFLEMAPVRDMIKLMYRHTQLHQRDIRRYLHRQTPDS